MRESDGLAGDGGISPIEHLYSSVQLHRGSGEVARYYVVLVEPLAYLSE